MAKKPPIGMKGMSDAELKRAIRRLKPAKYGPSAVTPAASRAIEAAKAEADKAKEAALDRDITELLREAGLDPVRNPGNLMKLFLKCTGLKNFEAASRLVDSANQVLVHADGGDDMRQMVAVLAFLKEMRPRGGVQTLLAGQMLAVHFLSMRLLRSTFADQSLMHFEACTRRITSFMRLFNEQAITMQKLKGRPPQKVIVQHVNVNDGGQAMIGNLNAGRRGRALAEKRGRTP